MDEELKIIEGDIVPIYENVKGERVINARELHKKLNNKRKFTDWIKQRVKQYDFVENEEFWGFSQICEKPNGGRPSKEYYVTIDMAKELCMVENNEIGKQLRKYFIEVEKRYKSIVESPQNIFDVMHLALNQIEENEKRLSLVENISNENTKEIKEIMEWFENNKSEIEYKIIYERNTKNGKKGEVKEQGYKIENVCYKIIDKRFM